MPNQRARLKFIIYLRVSTADQHAENQIPDLLAHLERSGITLPARETWEHPERPPEDPRVKWYIESASGYTFNRRLYIRLLKRIKHRRAEALLVWRLDRLGRLALQLHKLFDLCQRTKTNLISLRENLDLTTPTGRFFATIMAGLAELEGGIKSERQRIGLTRCREKAARIMQLAQDGLSPALVAEETRIKTKHVETVVKRNGGLWWGGSTPGRPRRGGFAKAKSLTGKKLGGYIAAGVPVGLIAKAYGISVRTVQLRIQRFNLDRPQEIPPEIL